MLLTLATSWLLQEHWHAAVERSFSVSFQKIITWCGPRWLRVVVGLLGLNKYQELTMHKICKLSATELNSWKRGSRALKV